MSVAVTRMDQDTRTLYVAFELGEKEWKLAERRQLLLPPADNYFFLFVTSPSFG